MSILLSMFVSVQNKKIFMLLEKLERKIKEKEVSKDEINKQLKFIGKKMESNT